MATPATPEEVKAFNDASALLERLWAKSQQITGLTTDPKMFSIMLFRRLRSNHRGFAVLHQNGLPLESDIILRAGIEAAICISANFYLRDEFVQLMLQDAASTMQGQIKLHRDEGSKELVSGGEAAFRALQAKLPPGIKAAKLDWNSLATKGKAPQLYSFYRMLSGVSSHVTGVSVMQGIAFQDENAPQGQQIFIPRRMCLMIMATASMHGAMLHAGMIDDVDGVNEAVELGQHIQLLSKTWDSEPDTSRFPAG